MEQIKKSQHKLILNQIYTRPNNINLKLVLNDKTSVFGTILNIEDEEIVIKTDSGTSKISFTSLDEVFILN